MFIVFNQTQINNMKNMLKQFIGYMIASISLTTACGVLLHDTGLDKAVTTSIYKSQSGELGSDIVKMRTGSNLHPHAEQMSLKKDGRSPNMMPRKRVSKQSVAAQKMALGYHGDGVCMPFAGEWV